MKRYLVIGSGRWATHLQKSLVLAGLPHAQWARKSHSELDLEKKLQTATHVWLAISDQALFEWVRRLADFKGVILHSSGALEIPGAHSVHPLMSFGPELYADSFYSTYAFVTTSQSSKETLIPGLANLFVRITSEQKVFYHALCVLAGNGSVLLWQKFFSEMKNLGIPFVVSSIYTRRILENLLQAPKTALTGPLVRNDQITLNKDLEAIQDDPFGPVLATLIDAYRKSEREFR